MIYILGSGSTSLYDLPLQTIILEVASYHDERWSSHTPDNLKRHCLVLTCNILESLLKLLDGVPGHLLVLPHAPGYSNQLHPNQEV